MKEILERLEARIEALHAEVQTLIRHRHGSQSPSASVSSAATPIDNFQDAETFLAQQFAFGVKF